MSIFTRRPAVLSGVIAWAVSSIVFVQLAAQAGAIVQLPAQEMSVPLTDIGGRPVVEVSINGKGPYRMVVDTGATRTTLAADLVSEFAPANSTGPFVLDEIRVGSARLLRPLVGRAAALLNGLAADPPKGVLSGEAFPGAVLTFDFPGRRLLIRRGGLPAADDKRIFEYPSSDPLPTVPVRINNVEFRVHLDTGAPATISLPLAAAKTLGLESALVEKGTVRLVSGEFPRFEAKFNGRLSVGEFPLSADALAFSDMRPGPLPPKGVIGMALLKDFIVSVDAEHRRIAFDRPR